MLFEPPFTDLNDQGIDGVFDDDADLVKVFKNIDEGMESYIIAYDNLTSYKCSYSYIKKIVFFFDKVNSKHTFR